MRWTAPLLALGIAGVFSATVLALKDYNSQAMRVEGPAGQQWEITGEPSADIKRRARLGEADAQYQLGIWHRQTNRSVEDKQAVEWFKRAAEKNHLESQYYLALHYADGRGVLQDYNESARLITDLVSKNFPDAQAQLGKMYLRGLGLTLDKPKAYLWYNVAAANGSREAGAMRDVLSSQLSTTELAEAQKQSRILEQSLRANKDLGAFKPVLTVNTDSPATSVAATPNAEAPKPAAVSAPANPAPVK